VNLYESAEAYVLTAEIPGVRPDDLQISVEGDKVTLRGERKIEVPSDPRSSLHRRERQAGGFRRTVRLPVPLDSDKAEAQYRNGVLVLRLPKAEAHQPRRIAVQAS
jgi:HSP20 family protein